MRARKKYIPLIIWLLLSNNLFAADDFVITPDGVSIVQPGGDTTTAPNKSSGDTNPDNIPQQPPVDNNALPPENSPEAQPPAMIPAPEAQTLGAPTGSSNEQDRYMQEKCHVLDSNGNGLIKPYRADSGINLEGDANAWIWVPYGECRKINAGDFQGISREIRDKIEPSNLHEAQTLE